MATEIPYTAQVNMAGRFYIPRKALAAAGLVHGERLVCKVQEGVLVLERPDKR